MDQRHQAMRAWGGRYVVMMLDHGQHVSGELPVLRQELPALTVGETKTLFFDLAKRNPCLAGCLDALPELFSTGQHVDQNTEVVEQASQVGFLAITISDQLGKFPAHQGTTQRVPPKRQ